MGEPELAVFVSDARTSPWPAEIVSVPVPVVDWEPTTMVNPYCSLPALATTVTVVLFEGAVRMVCANPFDPVVAVVGETLAVLTLAANVTVTPDAGLPLVSRA